MDQNIVAYLLAGVVGLQLVLNTAVFGSLMTEYRVFGRESYEQGRNEYLKFRPLSFAVYPALRLADYFVQKR